MEERPSPAWDFNNDPAWLEYIQTFERVITSCSSKGRPFSSSTRLTLL